MNALALVGVITVLLSIVYIISTTAFNALIALQAMALAVSYVPPIFFIMVRKMRGEPLPDGPYKLGRYGVYVNLLALLYLIYIIIWMPFPSVLPIDGKTMNYAGPLLGAVIVGALLDWVISGRKRFEVPVARTL